MTFVHRFNFKENVRGIHTDNVWKSLFDNYSATVSQFRTVEFHHYINETHHCKILYDDAKVTGIEFPSEADYIAFLLKL